MNAKQPVTQQSDDVNLLDLLGVVLDYKQFIVAVVACFAFVGILYAMFAAPVYQAAALLQIENKKAGLAGLEGLSELTGKAPEAITEIELIKSRWVVGKAVDNLHLDIAVTPSRFPLLGNLIARKYLPKREGDVAESPLSFLTGYDWGGAGLTVGRLELPDYLMGKKLLLIANGKHMYQLRYKDELLLTGSIGELVSKNGVLIQVDRLLANPDQKFTVVKSARLSIIDMFRGQLAVAERGKNTGIIGMSLESPDPAFAKRVLDEVARQYVQQNIERMSAEAANGLKFLKEQLPQVQKEMERATDALNKYQVTSKSVDISIETTAVLDQIVKLDTSISELKLKQVEMDTRFTREHPAYQTLLSQLNEMQAKKKDLENKVSDLPETQQELLRLNRDVQVSTQIYTQLLNKSQELDVLRAGTVGNARIIDTAEVDVSKPVKPKRSLIVLLSLLLGVIVSTALAGLHVALTRGIENPGDIEELGIEVTATIPYSELQTADEEKLGESAKTLPLLAITHPTDPAMEAIRSLRTSLYFTLQEAPNNIVMISGPSPLVGKTFISANMAVMMAQAGKKVLLIDADMRKGYMHKFFARADSDIGKAGLSGVLSKNASLEDSVMPTVVEGLDFMPRGSAPDNPSELLLGARFSQLLKHVSTAYDVIVVDTPPILAVADAIIVGKQAGSSYIVTRFSKNPVGEVQATIKRFEANGIKINGAILNATQKRSLSYYGYQKYSYGNYHYNYSNAGTDTDTDAGQVPAIAGLLEDIVLFGNKALKHGKKASYRARELMKDVPELAKNKLGNRRK
ncbi:MAG TPA: polysaccharide biosynthesis tyrosine autokinase [Pseudomonadales bacterium]|nr:polysaccharide biosynthesis tyrosine autokinase [Pseudomonadales bacterium]